MRLALYFFCRATRTFMSENMMMNDPDHSAWNLNTVSTEARAPRKRGGITPYNGLYGEAPPERGVPSDFKYVTKKCFEKMHSPISLFFKNTIIRFVVPPKFCKSIAFNFFWGDFSQEKLKTMLIPNFWGTAIKRIMVFLKKAYSSLAHLPKCTLFDPQNFA